jgi:D-3-phosphoglycerate dehydrogenase
MIQKQQSNPWRIVVTDIAWPSIQPEAEVLAQVGGELILAQAGTEEELMALVVDADAILTCWNQVSANVIARGKKLKVIGRYGIGVDNIDVQTASAHGILVTNVPTYCLDEVSEHAMALILACGRRICFYNHRVHSGNWEISSDKQVFRLRGKTLGIIGFGNIGQRLAQIARGFDMHVLICDPFISGELAQKHNSQKTGLEFLLQNGDFISIHAPLVESTHMLIDESKLRSMKPTAYLINTARGKIIDQDALVLALKNGWIAGAALDVFTPEPLPQDHPLLSMPNVITTPHTAFYSEEALLDLEIHAAENVAMALSGHRPPFIVNPEVLESPRWSHLQQNANETEL